MNFQSYNIDKILLYLNSLSFFVEIGIINSISNDRIIIYDYTKINIIKHFSIIFYSKSDFFNGLVFGNISSINPYKCQFEYQAFIRSQLTIQFSLFFEVKVKDILILIRNLGVESVTIYILLSFVQLLSFVSLIFQESMAFKSQNDMKFIQSQSMIVQELRIKSIIYIN
ncbi:hypothetical protein pb186bvf_021180 [Paramecium bursaria]